MAEKKNLLTDKGLKKLEDELQELRVVKRKEVAQKLRKRESRVTYQRMLSMMLQRMSKKILRLELKS